jgi:hypothetical protein
MVVAFVFDFAADMPLFVFVKNNSLTINITDNYQEVIDLHFGNQDNSQMGTVSKRYTDSGELQLAKQP